MKRVRHLFSLSAVALFALGCGDNGNIDPDASDLAVETAEDTPISVTLEGVDANGDAVSFAVVRAPSNGTLSGTAPNVTYTPDPDFFGSDNFLFEASDGEATSQGTVTITVTAVNDAPVIAAVGNQSTNEDTDLGPIVLNVSDVDNDLSELVVSGLSGDDTLVANSGIVIVATGGDPEMTVSPLPDQNGDVAIGVTVSDGQATASTDFDLTVNPINDAPTVTAPGNQTTRQGPVTDVTFTIADVDDDPASLVVTAESGNTAILPNDAANIDIDCTSAPDCTITLTPVSSTGSTAVVTITVDDGALTDDDTFELAVTNVLAGQADSFDATGNTLLSVAVVNGVLANDDDDGDTITASLVTAPTGTLILQTDGSFTYQPPTGQDGGTDTFVYEVTDGFDTAQATATINLDEIVWYVNNQATSGDGSSASPFAALSDAEGATTASVTPDDDIIYVFEGDSTSGTRYDGGITLGLGQKLIGQGVALVVDRFGADVTLRSAGTAPLITNTGGAAVTLGDDNEIRGVTIDEPAGLGLDGDSTPSLVASLVVEEVTFNIAAGSTDHAIFVDNTNPAGAVSIDIINNVIAGDFSGGTSSADGIRLNIGAGVNDQTAEIEISGNDIDQVDNGVIVDIGGQTGTGVGGPNQVTIFNNTIDDFDTNGIDIGPDDTSDSEFFITDNAITGDSGAVTITTSEGIDVRPGMTAGGVAEVTITGNTVTDVDSVAIDVAGTGSTDAGILVVQIGGAAALQNTISGPGTFGIHIEPNASARYCATVDNNAVTGATSASLFEFDEDAANTDQPQLQLSLVDNSDNVGFTFERTDDGLMFFGEDAASPRIGSQVDADVVAGVAANGNTGTATVVDTTGGGTGNPITIVAFTDIATTADDPSACVDLANP